MSDAPRSVTTAGLELAGDGTLAPALAVARTAPRPRLGRLYTPHRIDMGPGLLARACLALFARHATASRVLERAWHPDGLAFLSVRSAFDAALTALAYAPGDEILVSSVNIEDMIRIIEAHGLRVVPVDLDPRTLAPDPGDLESRITPRTRAILVAHLFGGRADLAPIAAVARRHGLLLLEDAAQAFAGGDWHGHPEADLSFFSFGLIKTATALGGALVRVADPRLRERMGQVQDGWPLQPRSQFAKRLAKAFVYLVLQVPALYGLFDRVCALWGTSAGEAGRKFSRGFGGGGVERLLPALRHRPSGPLLRFLAERLARVNVARVYRRAAHGEEVFAALPELAKPGHRQSTRTHWLLPVTVPAPATLRRALRDAGFETSGSSNVVALGGERARAMMEKLVFLPAYPELPPGRSRVLVDIVCAHLDREC